MGDWFAGFSGLESVFLVCAIVGGTIFVIRMVLQFMGVFDDVDADFDHPGDVHDVHMDSDVGFTLLTFQGLQARRIRASEQGGEYA